MYPMTLPQILLKFDVRDFTYLHFLLYVGLMNFIGRLW
jgi:hypothetical protein